MAKVGYIFKANSYDALDADKEWMRQYGCVQVVEEECAHEALSGNNSWQASAEATNW